MSRNVEQLTRATASTTAMTFECSLQRRSTHNPYDDITAAEPAVLDNVALSDLHIQDLLSSGGYAKTFRGVFNGQPCAVKRIGELLFLCHCGRW